MPKSDVVTLHCQSMTMRASAALAGKLQTGLHFARLHEPCIRIKELPSLFEFSGQELRISETDIHPVAKSPISNKLHSSGELSSLRRNRR